MRRVIAGTISADGLKSFQSDPEETRALLFLAFFEWNKVARTDEPPKCSSVIRELWEFLAEQLLGHFPMKLGKPVFLEKE